MPTPSGKRKRFPIPKRLLQRRQAGEVTLREIAEACGVSIHAVCRELNRRGIPGGAGQGRRPDEERRRYIAELRGQGLTFPQIARQLGVTPQCVHRTFQRSGRKVRLPWVACSECGREITPRLSAVPDDRPAWCLACLAKHPEATFGQRVKAYRLAASMTLAALGKRVGLTGTIITLYEQDRVRPRPRSLAKLIRVLGVGVVRAVESDRKPARWSRPGVASRGASGKRPGNSP